MSRTKAVIAVSFALVFAAGLAVGRLTAGVDTGRSGRSWLGRELELTAEQRQQMRRIWSEAMGGLRGAEGQRPGEMFEERRRAVRELLTERQLERYEEINAELERKRRQFAEQRREAFEEAIARTKEILTPEQRRKYEKLLERMRRHREDRRGPPGDGPPRFDRSDRGAVTPEQDRPSP